MPQYLPIWEKVGFKEGGHEWIECIVIKNTFGTWHFGKIGGLINFLLTELRELIGFFQQNGAKVD